MSDPRPPKTTEVLAALPGAVVLVVDVLLWIASDSVPVGWKVALAALGAALMFPFLRAVWRVLWATWRRGSGFYRLLDAEIERGARYAATLWDDPREWEGWEVWTTVREWDRRVFTILAAYSRRYADIYWPGSGIPLDKADKEFPGGSGGQAIEVERRVERLRAIRSMGPPTE